MKGQFSLSQALVHSVRPVYEGKRTKEGDHTELMVGCRDADGGGRNVGKIANRKSV